MSSARPRRCGVCAACVRPSSKKRCLSLAASTTAADDNVPFVEPSLCEAAVDDAATAVATSLRGVAAADPPPPPPPPPPPSTTATSLREAAADDQEKEENQEGQKVAAAVGEQECSGRCGPSTSDVTEATAAATASSGALAAARRRCGLCASCARPASKKRCVAFPSRSEESEAPVASSGLGSAVLPASSPSEAAPRPGLSAPVWRRCGACSSCARPSSKKRCLAFEPQPSGSVVATTTTTTTLATEEAECSREAAQARTSSRGKRDEDDDVAAGLGSSSELSISSPPASPTSSAARGWMDWKRIVAVDSVMRALPRAEAVEAWLRKLVDDGYLSEAELAAFCKNSVAKALAARGWRGLS